MYGMAGGPESVTRTPLAAAASSSPVMSRVPRARIFSMAPLARISSTVASAAAKGTPEKKWVPVKYTFSAAGLRSGLPMATAMG